MKADSQVSALQGMMASLIFPSFLSIFSTSYWKIFSRSSSIKPGAVLKLPSSRKQPSVVIACRCGLKFKKSP
ncbi:MAG: hypothetical protein A2277_06970 [Desulfobacterales bacterium RIFOXYA12_FULL_46_15]|nr:MAG: hypothetical protein A2277_06970 [Desulfobacterales bacterium RIFOXYA12_FULL_46_15]